MNLALTNRVYTSPKSGPCVQINVKSPIREHFATTTLSVLLESLAAPQLIYGLGAIFPFFPLCATGPGIAEGVPNFTRIPGAAVMSSLSVFFSK